MQHAAYPMFWRDPDQLARVTLLAPDIIDAILDGQLGPDTTLATLMDPFPIDWDEQRLDERFSRS